MTSLWGVVSGSIDGKLQQVQMSATLSAEATERRTMEPFTTHSRIKWCRTSMCFELLWLTGFLASSWAPRLSMKREVGWLMSCLRSCMRCRSQMASFAASEDAMYSASVDDWDTLVCSFDLQEMGPPANKKTAPETERRVLGSMA